MKILIMKVSCLGKFTIYFSLIILLTSTGILYVSAQSYVTAPVPYANNTSLPTPIPIFPENNAYLTNNRPTFYWSQDKNIPGISYHFEWTLNNPNFDSSKANVYNSGSPTTNLTLDYPLPNGDIYWRVFTEKSGNVGNMSLPSQILKVHIDSTNNEPTNYTVPTILVSAGVSGVILFVKEFLIDPKKRKQLSKLASIEKRLEAYGRLSLILEAGRQKIQRQNINSRNNQFTHLLEANDIENLRNIFAEKRHLFSNEIVDEYLTLERSDEFFQLTSNRGPLLHNLTQMQNSVEAGYEVLKDEFEKLTDYKVN